MILDTLIFAIALNFMWLALHIMDGFTIKRLDKKCAQWQSNEAHLISVIHNIDAGRSLALAELESFKADAQQSRYLQDWIEQKPFREHWAGQ